MRPVAIACCSSGIVARWRSMPCSVPMHSAAPAGAARVRTMTTAAAAMRLTSSATQQVAATCDLCVQFGVKRPRVSGTPRRNATPSGRGFAMETQDAVLLTGSTGFVGMELLARLLERTDLRVYALVRAEDRDAAAERLRRTVRGVVGGDGTAGGRVVPVPGDITKPGLGL